MDRLAENQYVFETTKDKLRKLGFRYSKKYEGYVHTFVAYSYKKIVPMIYCRITVDEETKRAWLNVCDDNDRLYAPYYNDEYGKNVIMQDIEKAISIELGRLGIEKVD